MKAKLLLIILSISVFSNVKAQAPQGMNYQAIARDASGAPLINKHIGIRFSITNGSGGTLLYQEHDTTTTNKFGLFTHTIGNGTPDYRTLSSIPWALVTAWMEVEMDPTGNTTYVDMGSSQLLSVPYALYSQSTGDTALWRTRPNGIYYNLGNVGVGSYPHPSAKLDVSSQQQGFLLPRMTTSQRDSIGIVCDCNLAEGLMIFNTTTKCFEAYVNDAWYSTSCPSVELHDTVLINPGTYSWTVPPGVTSVSVVCVGGGAGSGYDIADGGTGGTSSFGAVCYGYGGHCGATAPGGSFLGDSGGNGGAGAAGGGAGGGAGGYSGNGGDGVGSTDNPGNDGAGGGGGGGSQCYINGTGGGGAGGGGGVGLYGIGANGTGGSVCTGSDNAINNGHGGSPYNGTGTDGQSGNWGSFGAGGFPGGGAAGGFTAGGGGLGYKNNIAVTPGQQISVVVGAPGAAGTHCNCGEEPGAGGAVRIIWGAGKSFPSNAR